MTTTMLHNSFSNNASITEFESTADSLRRNDERVDGTTLDLDSALDLGDDLDDLIDGITRNTTISNLQLEGHVLCQLNPDDGQRLLHALGGLPSLTKLHLHNYVAPLPMLTGLLQKARTLESLTLHTAQLAGINQAQGDEFAAAIASLPCLEAFKCANVILGGSLSLEKLAWALSDIWGLQKVELELEQGGSMSCPALQALCQCPNLKELRLWRMTFHPEHLILMATMMQHNHTLQQLELGELGYADHDATSYRAVAEMLRQNSCLENFGMINFSGLNDEGCIAMARALQENTTLTEINVRGCDNHVMSLEASEAVAQMFSHNSTLQQWGMNTVGVNEHGAAVIAGALGRDNRTLQSLMLQRIVGDTTSGYMALHDMLETNTTLHRVYPEAIGETKAEMDFWLLLNQLKLRNLQLHTTTSRNDFLRILTNHRQDVNIVFYLLSINPDFLH